MTLDIQQLLAKKISMHQEKISTLKAKAILKLTGEQEEIWSIDGTLTPPVLKQGAIEGPQVTIILDRSVFESMASGEMSPQKAFLSGKVKVEGNLGLSLKLGELLLT